MGSATLFSFGTLIRMNQRFFFNDTDTIAGDNFDEVRVCDATHFLGFLLNCLFQYQLVLDIQTISVYLS